MYTLTRIIIIGLLLIIGSPVLAQETETNDRTNERIAFLERQKEEVTKEERNLLKAEVEAINSRLDRGEITSEEAEDLKKKAAERRAANIENRIAIIDNKIALAKRNDEAETFGEDDEIVSIRISRKDDEDKVIYFGNSSSRTRKYDRRTNSDLVFAFGFNNAIIDGQDLGDSPYKLGGSGFIELGWDWKTRLLKESNAVRLKYGISFVWNKLNIKDNQYLVRDGDMVMLEEFPLNINKAKFRTTSIVVPVHLEFGPSRKIDKDSYFRYSTNDQFRFGIGGFVGLNMGTLQKLKFDDEEGRDVKDKIKSGYRTNDFVYGLSAYIGVDDTALYVKYNLNPIFSDQMVDQNNISLGVRFDLD